MLDRSAKAWRPAIGVEMEQRGTLLYGSGRCLHRPRGQSRIRLKDRRVRLLFCLKEKICVFLPECANCLVEQRRRV